ncbi:hypothetical protein [Streptomyces alkaliterrae]|uniref:Uncharacterized protein n=1 Tax=Streptomyces alkaliterrae TaxID=2213162 RepID=A0A5P0YX05_9ACTN|nr:hypothetical protein [Streptomyces alkaliterrae]MBB1256099.1 hypothetical protein [Streptomyces alkaliterrae]MBB1262067.1 hypothetical protein [Streptomyces alkaliterrae]MQS04818.1 hypothetical protein [Streptomyces alkaliterrae]
MASNRGRDRDDEPIMLPSGHYNTKNPVGLALTVITIIGFIVFMIMITNRLGPFAPKDYSSNGSISSFDADHAQPGRSLPGRI